MLSSSCVQVNSDLPLLRDIKVMGYSLRSWDYRYTLWLGFDPNTFMVGVRPAIGSLI